MLNHMRKKIEFRPVWIFEINFSIHHLFTNHNEFVSKNKREIEIITIKLKYCAKIKDEIGKIIFTYSCTLPQSAHHLPHYQIEWITITNRQTALPTNDSFTTRTLAWITLSGLRGAFDCSLVFLSSERFSI